MTSVFFGSLTSFAFCDIYVYFSLEAKTCTVKTVTQSFYFSHFEIQLLHFYCFHAVRLFIMAIELLLNGL